VTGTLINVLAVLAGGTIGLIIGSRLPERYSNVFFHVVGLFYVDSGVSMAIKNRGTLAGYF
jgi:uncharacterized membrane protein YqgA involved in biofilm formation